MLNLRKGDKVVKLLLGGGYETASLATVTAVDKKRGLFSTDESHVSRASDIQADGVQTYRLEDGRASANYISGFSSRIVMFEG